MSSAPLLEVWLRGPVPAVPPLLQPVAHALLQAREEVQALMAGFPEEKLNEQPAGLASPAFHLQHLSGVLNRLLTYARAETLSEAQLTQFKAENEPVAGPDAGAQLVQRFSREVEAALAQLRGTSEATLTEVRGVGRAQVPSTHIGLLTHAAEHTMRHVGQLLVTVRVLQAAP
ncbi:hypothetical protein GCM10023185_12990 [Hymenobacter saemangeumensis]|uniref:DinB-like domain-containing protein n=1 Tax=Hymenobacter saemangeumensis TaxID=1084522 RepID=A0ABP8I7C3_9BACT